MSAQPVTVTVTSAGGQIGYALLFRIASGQPVRSIDGRRRIVDGLEVGAFSRARIDASVAELIDERDAVRALGLLP